MDAKTWVSLVHSLAFTTSQHTQWCHISPNPQDPVVVTNGADCTSDMGESTSQLSVKKEHVPTHTQIDGRNVGN